MKRYRDRKWAELIIIIVRIKTQPTLVLITFDFADNGRDNVLPSITIGAAISTATDHCTVFSW